MKKYGRICALNLVNRTDLCKIMRNLVKVGGVPCCGMQAERDKHRSFKVFVLFVVTFGRRGQSTGRAAYRQGGLLVPVCLPGATLKLFLRILR